MSPLPGSPSDSHRREATVITRRPIQGNPLRSRQCPARGRQGAVRLARCGLSSPPREPKPNFLFEACSARTTSRGARETGAPAG